MSEHTIYKSFYGHWCIYFVDDGMQVMGCASGSLRPVAPDAAHAREAQHLQLSEGGRMSKYGKAAMRTAASGLMAQLAERVDESPAVVIKEWTEKVDKATADAVEFELGLACYGVETIMDAQWGEA